MPLLDHFHPPLSESRHWESFHASWTNEIMATLNQGVLPRGYFAETQVHFGSRVEVDVASLRQPEVAAGAPSDNGGLAVQTYSATDVLVMPTVFPDEIEVQIIQRSGGPTCLCGKVCLVPANGHRLAGRGRGD